MKPAERAKNGVAHQKQENIKHSFNAHIQQNVGCIVFNRT